MNPFKPKLDTIWLGATDSAREGTFVWAASKRLVSDGYSNWAPKQPDNLKGNEVRRFQSIDI